MNTPYESADLHLNVGAYALDALDPADSAAFEGHLAHCESCTNELNGMAETTGLLAASQQVAPPALLRSHILAAIAITPQLAPLPISVAKPVPDHTSSASDLPESGEAHTAATPDFVELSDVDTAAESRSNVIPITRRRLPFASRVLAVAAAVLAVAGGGLGWRSITLSNDLQQMRVAAGQVTSILTASDAKTTTSTITGGGNATVVSSASLDRAVLVANNMTPAPSGHVYQLWLMTSSGDATPAGFMDPDTTGRDAEVILGSINAAALVGITVEPTGGSTGPTTKPVLAVHI